MPWPDHWTSHRTHYYPAITPTRRPTRHEVALSNQNYNLQWNLYALNESHAKIKKSIDEGLPVKPYRKMTYEEIKNIGRAAEISGELTHSRRGRRGCQTPVPVVISNGSGRHHYKCRCCPSGRPGKGHGHCHCTRRAGPGCECSVGVDVHVNGSQSHSHSHSHHHGSGRRYSSGDYPSDSRYRVLEQAVQDLNDVTFGTRVDHKRASHRFQLGNDMRDMGYPSPGEWW